MNVLMLAAEGAPFVKVGGLGDVAGALPAAVRRLDHDMRLVIPRYRSVDPERWELSPAVEPFAFAAGHETIHASLLTREQHGVPVYFVDIPWLFGDRASVYGDGDDARRFVLFCAAALAGIERLGWKPDVLHTNDWHTAIVPGMLKGGTVSPFFRGAGSMLTIHNMAYQGWVDRGALVGAGACLPGFVHEQWVNLLALGLGTADVITAVSPTYVHEITSPYHGHGLDWILRWRRDRVHGILNGIDTESYNPATDPAVAANYSVADRSGKADCKAALQREAGLPEEPDRPLLAMIGRLVDQKGFDLLAASIEPLLTETPLQIVILGTGEPRYHDLLAHLESRFHARLRAWLRFDADLARRIYAGADMLLMPSRFEPCGLSQMIAMRYGTVPVVHGTGGLVDTVHEGPPDDPRTGFVFWNLDPETLRAGVRRALAAYARPGEWVQIIRNGMSQDFSWRRSAETYVDLYRQAVLKAEG